MELTKVLYVSQEIDPYISSSPLALYGRSLAQTIQEKGAEVRTFMPKYGNINERRNQLHEVIRLSGVNIIIDDNDHPLVIKVATLLPSRLQVYFIDNDDYFMRHPSGQPDTVHTPELNDERAMFFVRGTAETVRKLRWTPSVVHCIGWMAALTPLYLKTYLADDPVFASSKVVYSLVADHGSATMPTDMSLDSRMIEKLRADGFTDENLASLGTTPDTRALQRLAIDFADAIAVADENVDPDLIAYAKASGKPVLEYSGEYDGDSYYEFYRSL